MVRPNQIISSDVENREFQFLMFAQSEERVVTRVLLLNFPMLYVQEVVAGDKSAEDFIENVTLVTEGGVNRYAVTVSLP